MVAVRWMIFSLRTIGGSIGMDLEILRFGLGLGLEIGIEF